MQHLVTQRKVVFVERRVCQLRCPSEYIIWHGEPDASDRGAEYEKEAPGQRYPWPPGVLRYGVQDRMCRQSRVWHRGPREPDGRTPNPA
jgi:hypothetical protein